MSLEPAAALLVGAVALHQMPGLVGAAGVGFVVAAGIGAERTGGRERRPPASTPVPGQSLRVPTE
jgi:inner membrane transporter RhtA